MDAFPENNSTATSGNTGDAGLEGSDRRLLMKRSKIGKEIVKGLKEALHWAKGEIELPTTVVEKIPIANLIVREGLTVSTSDARRIVEQGGVSLNGTPITDARAEVVVRTGDILGVGRKRKSLLAWR